MRLPTTANRLAPRGEVAGLIAAKTLRTVFGRFVMTMGLWLPLDGFGSNENDLDVGIECCPAAVGGQCGKGTGFGEGLAGPISEGQAGMPRSFQS